MNNFTCPICKSILERSENSYICKNNHSFDIAKEGYINLLPINKKKSKLPGDNREMMLARREFLNSGGYYPLVVKLVSVLTPLIKDKVNLFDLGCGEGYYTGHLKKALPRNSNVSGLDISKVAIRYASKRYKDINFCVASAFSIPLMDNSVDILTRIYAPSLDSELLRCIKKGGFLVTVTPGPRHLYQLREVIYKEVREHLKENSAPNGFIKKEGCNFNYMLKIENRSDMENLINMTPFAWKFTKEKREKLLENNQWSIECDFNIEVYVKQ